MVNFSNKVPFLWVILTLVPAIMSCTSQEGFRTTDPKEQTISAGNNFLNTGRWKPIRGSQRTQAFEYVATEGFYIPENQIEVSILEKELQDFIKNYNISTNDIILLDGIRTAQGALTNDSQNAINRLKFSLQDLGYKSTIPARQIAILSPGIHNSAVMIHRKIIVAPECEIKSHPRSTRPTKRALGCAQEVNLANMVVSPTGLDGTAQMTSADSTASALGIDRYRKGEITPLLDTLSTSGISE
ncbi:CpaD family pilus assembly lipoprotein [Kiloniella sp. EL199]|uniref:CpaD family pilus assembly lipoprotein n=1 Tax=Kiloniella sp. EL199 TaxID=2107581 RepID=UPI000EA2DA2C|nr:CpaD family pilus assembly lipoprotein [Kiloniella sp. EL199]